MFDISLNSLTDEIGEGAYESGRWCQASLDQGVLVSTATLRVATSNMHRHTEKLSGDTNLYTRQGQPRGRKGERQTAAQMHDLELEIVRASTASRLRLGENPYVK